MAFRLVGIQKDYYDFLCGAHKQLKMNDDKEQLDGFVRSIREQPFLDPDDPITFGTRKGQKTTTAGVVQPAVKQWLKENKLKPCAPEPDEPADTSNNSSETFDLAALYFGWLEFESNRALEHENEEAVMEVIQHAHDVLEADDDTEFEFQLPSGETKLTTVREVRPGAKRWLEQYS